MVKKSIFSSSFSQKILKAPKGQNPPKFSRNSSNFLINILDNLKTSSHNRNWSIFHFHPANHLFFIPFCNSFGATQKYPMS
jgi:hypothetical protein